MTKTVLIADDEPSLRRLVHATIDSPDYEVLEAGDGDEAWTLIRERRPDVVLLDVQMPGKNGLEVCRLLRADPTLAQTRVIMLTSRSQEADFWEGRAAGADRYLTKPFSPIEVLDTVEQALRGE